MIKVKFLYSFQEEYSRGIIDYSCDETFLRLVNTYNLRYDDEELGVEVAPFRDETSLRLIHNIDKAEFTSKYGVRTPYGCCSVTSLCGTTQYGLSVLEYSKRGAYTRCRELVEPDEQDVTPEESKNLWTLLSLAPYDILLYVPVYRMGDLDQLIFMLEPLKRFIIENYRDNMIDETTERELLVDLSLEQIAYFFLRNILTSYAFDLQRDYVMIIEAARKKVEQMHLFRRPPLVFHSFQELADGIGNERESNNFEWIGTSENERDFFDEDGNFWDVNLEKAYNEMRATSFHKDTEVIINNYLIEQVDRTVVKYPYGLLIQRNLADKTFTMQEFYIVKYPTFSEMFTEVTEKIMVTQYNLKHGFDRDKNLKKYIDTTQKIDISPEVETYFVVFDVETADLGGEWLKQALCAEKISVNQQTGGLPIVSFYSGIELWEELVDFTRGYDFVCIADHNVSE